MSSFVEKRQQLRQSYVASMIEKVTILKQHYQELKEGIGNSETFHTDLHKLSGSAGMYGFDKISSDARQVMNMLQTNNDSDASQSVEIDEIFTNLLVMMENAGLDVQ